MEVEQDQAIDAAIISQHRKLLLPLFENNFAVHTAIRMGARIQDAEDVAQTAFIRSWNSIHTFKEGNIHGWVTKIIRNIVIDRGRASTREINHYNPLPLEEVTVFFGEEPSDEIFVEETVIENITRERVSAGMNMLSEDRRQAIELVYFEGYTYNQAGEQVGKPTGTIKSQVSRGIRELEGVLREDAWFRE